MIAPDLAAPGPRLAPPRASKARDEASSPEAELNDAVAADADAAESKTTEDKVDFGTVLEEDSAESETPDQAAAAPMPQIATPPVDPLLATPLPAATPVPVSTPEIVTETEVAAVPAVVVDTLGATPAVVAAAPPAIVESSPPNAIPAPDAPVAAAIGETAPSPEVAAPEVTVPEIAAPETRTQSRLSREIESTRPASANAAGISTPSVPADASNSRAAAPAPDASSTAGGPTLTPTANVDWRLSANAAALAPREIMPPATIQPQALAGQITLAIGNAVDKKVEIRLDPPELGRVHIHLTQTEHGLQAVVMAERPETHDLLRRHAEVLAKDLGAAGYENVSLDFATGGRDAPNGGERRAPEQSLAFAGGQTSAAIAPMANTSARGVADGALDIRL